jgi:hypothetical protein
LDAGLPDGLFSYQKSQFGYILDGLAMQDVCAFYDHLVYVWPFDTFYDYFVYFEVIWYIFSRFGKSLQ